MDTEITAETQPSASENRTEDPAQVQQSTVELVEKHRQRKPRSDRGVKRGPRSTTADNTASVQTAPVDPALQLNLELVKKSVTALVTTTDAICVRAIYGKARRIGCDDDLAKSYAQAAGLTKDENNVIAECSAVIFARSEWLVRHAPEVMLGCVAISYGVRIATVLHRLDQLEAKLKKDESSTHKQQNSDNRN